MLFAGLLVLAAVSVGSYVAVAARRRPRTRARRRRATTARCIRATPRIARASARSAAWTLEPIPRRHRAPDAGSRPATCPGLATVHLDARARADDRRAHRGASSARALGGELELVGFVAPDEARIAARPDPRRRAGCRSSTSSAPASGSRPASRCSSIYSPELLPERAGVPDRARRRATPARGDAPMHDAARRSGRRAARLRAARRAGRGDRAARARAHGRARELVLRAPVSGHGARAQRGRGPVRRAPTRRCSRSPTCRACGCWPTSTRWTSRGVRAGDRARRSSPTRCPGRAFAGRVDFVYPTVSSETRTLKVRRRARQPGRRAAARHVRPGARWPGAAAPALVVPAEAVVDTGERRYVFVARAGGRFEPRARDDRRARAATGSQMPERRRRGRHGGHERDVPDRLREPAQGGDRRHGRAAGSRADRRRRRHGRRRSSSSARATARWSSSASASRWSARSSAIKQRAAGRDPGSLRSAGHRLHRVDGAQPDAGRGPGHLSDRLVAARRRRT